MIEKTNVTDRLLITNKRRKHFAIFGQSISIKFWGKDRIRQVFTQDNMEE